jgi:hypothetical protein
MGQFTAIKTKFTGAMLLGALTAGALAAAGIGSAPTARATCVSFFGIGNGPDCTSNLGSVAIAIGASAQAHADGLFGVAFSAGTNAITDTQDAFTVATAVGDNARASATGLFGMATQLGANGVTATQGSGGPGNLGLNFALNVSVGAQQFDSAAEALGVGNIAVNLFGNGTTHFGQWVQAYGNFSVATNLGGANNRVFAGYPGLGTGNLNMAFNISGSNNIVMAAPGPVAIAGAILQNGQTVTKMGPGVNINNGIVIGGAAATPPTAATGRHATTPTAAAGTHNRSGVAASATAKRSATK